MCSCRRLLSPRSPSPRYQLPSDRCSGPPVKETLQRGIPVPGELPWTVAQIENVEVSLDNVFVDVAVTPSPSVRPPSCALHGALVSPAGRSTGTNVEYVVPAPFAVPTHDGLRKNSIQIVVPSVVAGPNTVPEAAPLTIESIVGAGRSLFAPAPSEIPWPALSWIELATMRSLIEEPSSATPSPELWEIVVPGPI